MAKSSSISLFFILVLVCSTPAFEARKVLSLKKGEVSSTEESLDLATLPKGPTPHSSSSDDEGHAVVNINGRLFTLYLSSNNDSMPKGLSQVLESVTLLRFSHLSMPNFHLIPAKVCGYI
ncbi:hypothetical protein CK203_021703 [Vitis vinifera]|uniref:Uncharacterized protein n=1 Tax=Vitis vinifera TaxID=29760 RepID=A0A438J4G1_VITVI|nr:hypothetical protein CK203_021703 [Vitis vinifera]